MTIVYCPQCGLIYVLEVAQSCINPACQPTHEWASYPLEPVEGDK